MPKPLVARSILLILMHFAHFDFSWGWQVVDPIFTASGIERECVAVVQKVDHVLGRNRKVQTLHSRVAGTVHANHFASQVEQWTARVSWIDRRRDLEVAATFEGSIRDANDAA